MCVYVHLCMHVSVFVYVSLCVRVRVYECVRACVWGPMEGRRGSCGAGITGGCKLQTWVLGTEIWSSTGVARALTSEPSLQPQG